MHVCMHICVHTLDKQILQFIDRCKGLRTASVLSRRQNKGLPYEISKLIIKFW